MQSEFNVPGEDACSVQPPITDPILGVVCESLIPAGFAAQSVGMLGSSIRDGRGPSMMVKEAASTGILSKS